LWGWVRNENLMKKSIYLFFLASVLGFAAKAQETASLKKTPAEEGTVKWMTFAEAVEKSKTEKRSIFIDVYTDWCGWCKVMDKNTFNEPLVAKMLNEKYYPVKFNAEQTEDVVFAGTTFKFIAGGGRGTHQLAMALLNNQMSYPTVVFMDREFKSATPIPGYRKPEEFHKYLTFFSVDHTSDGQTAWQEFDKTYKSPYPAAPPAQGGN
jgi:thioredoxin-related protein